MGTNYYRIPKRKEFLKLKIKILFNILKSKPFVLADNHDSIIQNIINYDWKDEEGNNLIVHLGKRSSGWKFLWNFHRDKFYSNKEELLAFIRAGRVFDEYGQEQDIEEFIQMALTWCPDGWDSETYPEKNSYSDNWHDRFVDGLRIAHDQEHSTYFC